MNQSQKREIRIQIFEAQNLLLPHTNGEGHRPMIYLQFGKFHDVIMPTEDRKSRQAVHYDYDRTILARDDKILSIVVKDNSITIGTNKNISCKKLSRVPQRLWYDLNPEGKILIELTALNWGIIPRPNTLDTSIGPEETKHYYLPATLQKSLRYIRKPPIKEYKITNIKRIFPHIGQGTFGIVYKGTVKDRKSLIVAVKDIKVKDYTTFEEWRKEVEHMSHNIHKYVVEVFGYYCSSELLTIVMEYLERGTLFDLLHMNNNNTVQFTLLDCVRMARHVAIAIAFLHNHDVIHRDVKSMNILVGRDNVCKLSDFGSAKLIKIDDMIMHTVGKGTPFWMAPEVMNGNNYSFPADIYSFGIVLYEIFEKTLPQYDYERRTIALENYNFPSHGLVLSTLDINTQNRPTALHLAERLDFILNQVLNRVLGYQSIEPHTSLDEWYIQNGYVGNSTTQIDTLILNLIREKYKIEPKIYYHLIPSKKVKWPIPSRPVPPVPTTPRDLKPLPISPHNKDEPAQRPSRTSFIGYHPHTDRLDKSWNNFDLLKSDRIKIGDKHSMRQRIKSDFIPPTDPGLLFIQERGNTVVLEETPLSLSSDPHFTPGQIITLEDDYNSENFPLKLRRKNIENENNDNAKEN